MAVIAEVRNKVGWIKINRPNVLNSINLEAVNQINEALVNWENNNDIAFIVMYGEGEKGFCAGGDMKSFYELKENGAETYAKEFFTNEYNLDYKIHSYSKPIVVYMNGVVMGGGVGLSIGASHRIVNEKTKWAMPEMNIGFFPDVGASYFLNQMPGYIGRYLALTAQMIRANDALYVGAADYYLESERWEELKTELLKRNWSSHSIENELNEVLNQLCSDIPTPSQLEQEQENINRHFQHDTVEEIVASLKGEASKWATETLENINSKSPTSLKVALKQQLEGKHRSLDQCLEMEKNMAIHFMKSHDFYEGVRAVLVDKDRSPKWKPATLERISEEDINRYFTHVNV